MGIILRYNAGNLVLFEATGNLGVGLCKKIKIIINPSIKLIFKYPGVNLKDTIGKSYMISNK